MSLQRQILVVDDSTLIRAMLVDVLGDEGYRVITVCSGEDALDAIESQSPDLVLLDWLLPGVNGLEVLKRMRQMLPPGTPVIMITSCDSEKLLAEVFGAGATDYIKKPFSDVVVRARVAAALSAFRAQQELRQAAERDAAATRAKSEFLAGMSHEIRTPMTAILGFAEVLARGDLGPEQAEAVTTILRNGQYLLELINDILDVTKIEAGKFEIEGLRCSPVAIVAETAELMRIRAEAKGLALTTAFEGPIPETVLSDPTRLRQILINLVGNAVKFTQAGAIRVVVRLVDELPRPRLRFDIIDSGIGMSHEQVGRLFHPFVQGDSSIARRFGGTGLGLTICKRLAEMLGGRLTVVSELGKGSTFSLTIDPGSLAGVPLLTDVAEAVAVQPSQNHAAADNIRLSCRVLLADDGVDNQRLIAFLLRKAGATVVLADDGAMAVSQALSAREAGEPFDVILMDMNMPIMDGYEATRRLREAGFPHPIIALTANAMSGDRAKCLESGCDNYLTKPIDRRRLLTAVAGILSANACGETALSAS